MPNLLGSKEMCDGAFPRRRRCLLPASHGRLAAVAVAGGAERRACRRRPRAPGQPARSERSARSRPRPTRRAARRSASRAPTRTRTGGSSRKRCSAARRKAFAKLDANGNGALAFEEWAAKTIDKFQGADKDRSGWLTPVEYAATAPPPPKRKARCACWFEAPLDRPRRRDKFEVSDLRSKGSTAR